MAARSAPIPLWDLCAALAVVLARSSQQEPSIAWLRICIAAANEDELRALPTASLYRLLVFSRVLGVSFDSKLHELALDLLPSGLREKAS